MGVRHDADVDEDDQEGAEGGFLADPESEDEEVDEEEKAESEDVIRQLGGKFLFGKVLGESFSVDDLLSSGYDAVFLAYGASQGTRFGIKNEYPGLDGYISGVDFLLKVQVGSMEEYDVFTRRALGEDKGVHSFKTLITIRNIIENDVARRPLRNR